MLCQASTVAQNVDLLGGFMILPFELIYLSDKGLLESFWK